MLMMMMIVQCHFFLVQFFFFSCFIFYSRNFWFVSSAAATVTIAFDHLNFAVVRNASREENEDNNRYKHTFSASHEKKKDG